MLKIVEPKMVKIIQLQENDEYCFTIKPIPLKIVEPKMVKIIQLQENDEYCFTIKPIPEYQDIRIVYSVKRRRIIIYVDFKHVIGSISCFSNDNFICAKELELEKSYYGEISFKLPKKKTIDNRHLMDYELKEVSYGGEFGRTELKLEF